MILLHSEVLGVASFTHLTDVSLLAAGLDLGVAVINDGADALEDCTSDVADRPGTSDILTGCTEAESSNSSTINKPLGGPGASSKAVSGRE